MRTRRNFRAWWPALLLLLACGGEDGPDPAEQARQAAVLVAPLRDGTPGERRDALWRLEYLGGGSRETGALLLAAALDAEFTWNERLNPLATAGAVPEIARILRDPNRPFREIEAALRVLENADAAAAAAALPGDLTPAQRERLLDVVEHGGTSRVGAVADALVDDPIPNDESGRVFDSLRELRFHRLPFAREESPGSADSSSGAGPDPLARIIRSKRVRLLGPFGRLDRFLASPDLSRAIERTPEEGDGLIAWFFRNEPLCVHSEEGVWFDGPDLPWHLFGRRDGEPFYLRIPEGEDTVPFPPPGGKPIVDRPVVDGRPVPDMTILAPGRLDLETVRKIGARVFRAEGFSFAVHARADWSRVRLPGAPVLTAWHPDLGVAWLEWREDAIPAGVAARGKIRIVGEPGERLDVTVRGTPSWPVTGRQWTYRSSDPLSETYRDVEEIVLDGLPPGFYRVCVSGTARAGDGTEREVLRRFRGEVPPYGDPVLLDLSR